MLVISAGTPACGRARSQKCVSTADRSGCSTCRRVGWAAAAGTADLGGGWVTALPSVDCARRALVEGVATPVCTSAHRTLQRARRHQNHPNQTAGGSEAVRRAIPRRTLRTVAQPGQWDNYTAYFLMAKMLKLVQQVSTLVSHQLAVLLRRSLPEAEGCGAKPAPGSIRRRHTSTPDLELRHTAERGRSFDRGRCLRSGCSRDGRPVLMNAVHC